MEPTTIRLNNGMRLVHLPWPRPVCHFGLLIHMGSRDELIAEHGLAHFIEHCLFKGTRKRKTFHILNRLDSVGGELNAFTSKEETWIHAAFLSGHAERAIELIADIAFHSTFPAAEIEKEKEVIADEIKSYMDNPTDMLFEDFDGMIWNGHPLGRNILGTDESLKSFRHGHIMEFVKRRHSASNYVLSFVGNLPVKEVKRLAEKYFGDLEFKGARNRRKKFEQYSPIAKVEEKDVYQVQWIAGCEAYSFHDDRRIGLSLLNNFIGGPSMNNKLSMVLREKHALTYNVESNFQPLSDTGMFFIYLGVDANNLEKSRDLVYHELTMLRRKKLSTRQLQDIKKQIIGQIALSQDNAGAQMFALGKSLQLFNRIDTLEEVFEKINKVTASELLEIANEILDPSTWCSLVYTSNGRR